MICESISKMVSCFEHTAGRNSSVEFFSTSEEFVTRRQGSGDAEAVETLTKERLISTSATALAGAIWKTDTFVSYKRTLISFDFYLSISTENKYIDTTWAKSQTLTLAPSSVSSPD